MAPNDDSDGAGRTFDLFGLPLELREAIYDGVLADEEVTVNKGPKVAVSVRHAMPANLALVSHRFSEEFKKRELNVRIVLKDTEALNRGEHIEMPAFPRTFASLEMHVTLALIDARNHLCDSLTYCEVMTEFNFHRTTAKTTLEKLPHVRALSIHIYLPYSSQRADALRCALVHRGVFTDLKYLTDITIHQCPEHDHFWNPSEESAVVARWSAGTKQSERTDLAKGSVEVK
ncbi:hypothetical protein B0A55_04199 [Friedmanniomyces simplex]|uniref:Uncharacterized protein n=1 Tax=Friedmanniomyces simplex TaxID=329884 RepID=A0A4V5NJ65_9PEZI|nr:hypothetical protein B0A55_04199 [Friedmanniomyces simplex]